MPSASAARRTSSERASSRVASVDSRMHPRPITRAAYVGDRCGDHAWHALDTNGSPPGRSNTEKHARDHARFTPSVCRIHAHAAHDVFMTPLLCLLVLVSATLIDFAHARCVVAIAQRAPYRAALWSLLQWAGATVGFIVAVKVTFWVLPFEALGLYIGTVVAV